MSTSQPLYRPENPPVSFPNWKAALVRAAVPAEQCGAYQREILSFLHHCKIRRAPATIMLAKEYLTECEKQGASGSREALRWFFRTAPGTEGGAQATLAGESNAGGSSVPRLGGSAVGKLTPR